MCKRRSLLVGCSALMVGFLLAASSEVWGVSNDRSYLTFNRSVAIPGVTLAAGTYIFERAQLDKPDIVRVLSRDRTHVYLTAFTRPTARPAALRDDSLVVLGEAPRGEAPPIKAWFPLGSRVGHEFIYTR